MIRLLLAVAALVPLAGCDRDDVVRAPADIHPITTEDLAVVRDVRPAIAGLRIRWCRSQDACRP